MAQDAQAPVIVGGAQLVQRDADPREAKNPLEMLVEVAEGAAEDAGIGARALRDVDLCGVVDAMGWHPRNAPRLLADRVGARPARELVTGIGGESPLVMVSHIAAEIAAGRTRLAFVGGSSTVRTLRKARQARVTLDYPEGGEGEPEALAPPKNGSTELEMRYGLRMPVDVYPIFENALRAHRGLDIDTHMRRMGALMSPFTRVAAANPYAWFPVARTAEELATVTPENRMIAFPYPKRLNAIMETDQAAGVILTSAGTARALGIPEERLVYWWSGAHGAEAPWYPTERPRFHACPAMGETLETALERAGVEAGELGHLDLYSCFPVAVELAVSALGLAEDDPRGFTVIGGLPYAGGPGNNYTLHALVAMAERLRGDPGARGLVSGNGWYLTKHSAVVCSTEPPRKAPAGGPVRGDAAEPAVEIVEVADGPATIETYTVCYGRDGAPARGIVVGRLDGGPRFLANTPADRDVLESLVTSEGVGRAGKVAHVDGENRFEPS